jgi:hypothetical protein
MDENVNQAFDKIFEYESYGYTGNDNTYINSISIMPKTFYQRGTGSDKQSEISKKGEKLSSIFDNH